MRTGPDLNWRNLGHLFAMSGRAESELIRYCKSKGAEKYQIESATKTFSEYKQTT